MSKPVYTMRDGAEMMHALSFLENWAAEKDNTDGWKERYPTLEIAVVLRWFYKAQVDIPDHVDTCRKFTCAPEVNAINLLNM